MAAKERLSGVTWTWVMAALLAILTIVAVQSGLRPLLWVLPVAAVLVGVPGMLVLRSRWRQAAATAEITGPREWQSRLEHMVGMIERRMMAAGLSEDDPLWSDLSMARERLAWHLVPPDYAARLNEARQRLRAIEGQLDAI